MLLAERTLPLGSGWTWTRVEPAGAFTGQLFLRNAMPNHSKLIGVPSDGCGRLFEPLTKCRSFLRTDNSLHNALQVCSTADQFQSTLRERAICPATQSENHRSSHALRSFGFTLIELLVVIVSSPSWRASCYRRWSARRPMPMPSDAPTT